jgi:succinyl-diaminopimelate desuccinylase
MLGESGRVQTGAKLPRQPRIAPVLAFKTLYCYIREYLTFLKVPSAFECRALFSSNISTKTLKMTKHPRANNPTMTSRALLSLITSETPSHVALLQSFAQAPSPNPPGDTTVAAGVLTKYLNSHSIATETIAPQPTMPNIVTEFICGDPTGPRLLLNGHIDVFPAGDTTDWPRDPWSGEIVNGRLHGRGTVDMKAGTTASVIAYRYLYDHRQFLKGSVLLCAVSDEETGGKYGTKFLLEKERFKGDCMINAEPGGTNTIRFAEKGTLRLTFTVRTQGAHGAHVHRSANAIRIAAKLIVELAAVEEILPEVSKELREYMQRREVIEAVDEANGKGAAELMLKVTLNIGVIEGGTKVNVIPSKCVFEADIRLPIGLDRSKVLCVINNILASYPEVSLEVQEAASNPSSASDYQHPMVGILARNAEKIVGRKPVAIPSLGASDCKFYRYKDIPAFVFGISPETMAGKDESVDIEEFLKVVKTHVLTAWEYLGGEM